MRIVTGNGMVVETRGGGPPVLLVHGVGGPMMWEKLVPLLARTHEVVVPHLAGFGESAAPAKPMSSDDHAAALSALVGTMAAGRICVAGVSYGAEIAIRLAALAPEIIARLVLVSPTGMGYGKTAGPPRSLPGLVPLADRFPRLTARLLRMPALVELSSRRSFFDLANRPPDLVKRYREELSRDGHADALRTALREIAYGSPRGARLIANLALPVTFVWGQNDRVIPPPAIIESGTVGGEAGHPRDLRILPGCGHSVPMEKPDDLARIIAGPPPDGGGPRSSLPELRV